MSLRNPDKYAAYSALVLGFLVMVLGASMGFSAPFFLAAIALLCVSAVLLKVGDWLVPALLARGMMFPAFEGLWFKEDAVVVPKEDGYSATGYLELRILRSVADMKESEKSLFISAFHNFLSSTDHGFKLCLVAAPVDVSKELTRVRVKAEELLYKSSKARAEGDKVKERKLDEDRKYWKDLEKRLAKERPYDIAFYLQVTAKAVEEDAALARMRAERRKLAGGLASSMGVDAVVVKGRDLYKYGGIELLVPVNSWEMRGLEW
jgi:hypothetical protein